MRGTWSSAGTTVASRSSRRAGCERDAPARSAWRSGAGGAWLRTEVDLAGPSIDDRYAKVLRSQVVAELVQRAEIPARAIVQIVCESDINADDLPKVASEVGLAAGLPKNVDAYSVVRA